MRVNRKHGMHLKKLSEYNESDCYSDDSFTNMDSPRASKQNLALNPKPIGPI